MPDPNDGLGTEPTAVATPPATPVASGAPEPTPTPEPQASDELMQVQREQFKDDGYDYTRTVKNSKQFREAEASGLNALGQYIGSQINPATGQPVTIQEFLEAMQAPQEPVLPEEPGLTPPTEVPLTESRMQQILADRDKATQEATNQQVVSAAWDKEDEYAVKLVEKIGVPKDNFRHNPFLSLFKNHFLKEAIADSIPSYLGATQRSAMLNRPATEGQLAAAAEKFAAYCKDIGMEAVANFATDQNAVPNATLGGGAGGRPAGRTYSSLSPDDQLAAVAGAKGFEDVIPDP